MKNFVRIAAVLLLTAMTAQAATYTVNSSADTDDGTCDVSNCTLREAINAANAASGGTIVFAIGSGTVNIALASALPALSTPIILDATTQPGYVTQPLVQLTGVSTATHCLTLTASNSTVRGLDIGNCADGIAVLSNTGTAITNIAIERNFIGTRLATASINGRAISLDATGTSTLSGVTIGNGTPSGRNVLATFGFVADALAISGNTSDVTVAGNYFGVDESGAGLVTAARFTTDIGIYGSSSSTGILVGGSTAGARNVFGSGGGTQVNFKIDSQGSNLTIEGNYIGTDPSGTIRKGATNFGVWFFGQGTATIRNNVIATNGGNAISRGVTTTGPVFVQGNWINVKADGSGAFGFVPSTAIQDFSSAPGYTIGGPNPGDGNVVANYSTGVFVSSPGALVQGNLVGLDPTGTTILGSGAKGIATSFSRTEPGVFFRDNRVAGFTTGIEIGTSALATVDGNYVGTDSTGTIARPNTNGITVSGAAGRTILTSNVIAGNSGNGVVISTTTMPVTMNGNRIGVNASGNALPNTGDGIRVTSGTALKSIGTTAGAANTIANNGGVGINVTDGNQTSIIGNSIFNNGGLAIDLGTAGVTPNDAGDSDTGANGLQNAPVLISASSDAVATTVAGSLSSSPATTFTIELYANTVGDPSLYGEAQTFLSRFDVTTDGIGNASFSAAVPLQLAGTVISATATSAATFETSEMSNDVAVVFGGTIQFSAASSSVNESLGSTTITVTRTGGTNIPATVQYLSADGSATVGSDYTAVTGTLSFAAGETSKTFVVPIASDTLDETDETLTITLSGVTGSTLGTPVTTTITVLDDDAPPSVSVSDASIVEGDSGTATMTFDVALSTPSGLTATVDYATVDATASAGSDYGTRFGTLTFTPGETSKTVVITVNGDATTEADEAMELLLTSPSNASISDGIGVGTIANDDGNPTITIADATVIEGASGPASLLVAVTLSNPSSSTVTVDFSMNANTATSSDFTSSTGTLTFGPGITMQTIPVDVTGDTVVEGNESFFVILTNPANATISDGQGVVTIVDDDGSPALTVSDLAVNEADGNATLTVLLAPASAQTVTAAWTTSNNSASAPGDYAPGSNTLTFNPGETSQTIVVPITNDSATESSETFDVSLSSPSNASIADGSAIVTIIDDDPRPAITVNDLSAVEGAPAPFAVALSNPSASTITVSYATSNGTAGASDYTASSGTLTFNPGETSKPVNVATTQDTLQEPDETFTLTLSGATNGTITRPQAAATIVDDDGTPSLVVGDATVVEGNAGTTSATFVVTLAGNAAQTLTVDYATADGTALAGSDYAPTAGHLIFAPGTTTQTIVVPVVGDTGVEPGETFFVNLSNASNATISDNQGLGTITNDDTAAVVPNLSIADAGIAEGNAGVSQLTFNVTLSAPTTTTVSVDFATANGSAVSGGDYGANSGTLVFAPGVVSRTISVSVVGDTIVEGNETFVVNLSNAANANVIDAQATGTLLDDDVPAVTPTISIGDASGVEGNSGTASLSFAVTLSAPTTNTVTVDFATSGGTATSGADFATASGTLVFGPGVTSQTIGVAVAGDANVEGNETFVVTLSNAVNGSLLDAQATGTIVDDDTPVSIPSLSITGAQVEEGDSGSRSAVFSVRLSSASTETVTVDYATQDASASAGADYVSTSGSLVFPPGTTTRTITVAVLGDTEVEANETFRVRLSNAGGATIATAQANGTIVDDDVATVPPLIRVSPMTVVEGNSGLTPASFVVTLSHAATTMVHVSYATSDGTAAAGSDYASASGTITFGPGETSRNLDVAILGDRVAESDETFVVALHNPVGATLAVDRATGTIQDDDRSSVRAVFVIVGSGPGSGGSFFRTQLQLHNRADQPIAGELVFRPIDGSAPHSLGYALDPHETRDVGDLLAGGFGSIDVAPLAYPLPSGTMRVFNDGASGAPGLLAPLVDVADALRAGDHALLIAPADASALRYNVGMRSLDAGCSLTLTLRRANGSAVTTVSRELAPNTLVHISAASLFAATMENNDAIEVEVTRGSAIVYGSAVDNRSQDPSIIIAH